MLEDTKGLLGFVCQTGRVAVYTSTRESCSSDGKSGSGCDHTDKCSYWVSMRLALGLRQRFWSSCEVFCELQ